jgi:hypothetical protein
MDKILGWPPILWTLRVALFTLLVGCTYIFVLLLARFLRPAHVRYLLRAGLPRVKSVGGEFAGTKGEVHFAEAQDAQIAGLELRVNGLQTNVERLLLRLERHAPDEEAA